MRNIENIIKRVGWKKIELVMYIQLLVIVIVVWVLKVDSSMILGVILISMLIPALFSIYIIKDGLDKIKQKRVEIIK